MQALAERVLPLFAEYGVTSFVLVGYQEDGEGTVRRVCIANTAKNPAYEDGLRPVIHFAHMWNAVAVPPIQPPPEEAQNE